jgi:hypothetical protein
MVGELWKERYGQFLKRNASSLAGSRSQEKLGVEDF